jgi:hypothetical protein
MGEVVIIFHLLAVDEMMRAGRQGFTPALAFKLDE